MSAQLFAGEVPFQSEKADGVLCRPGPSTYARPDCKAKPCKMGTNPGRTHRFYTGEAVTPFGTGLSYTTFDYKIVSGPAAPVSLDFARDFLDAATEVGKQFPSKKLLDAVDPPVQYEVNVSLSLLPSHTQNRCC